MVCLYYLGERGSVYSYFMLEYPTITLATTELKLAMVAFLIFSFTCTRNIILLLQEIIIHKRELYIILIILETENPYILIKELLSTPH